MQLQMENRQNLVLSQKTIQMMNVIQMDSQELIAYIKNAVEDNPIFDMDFFYNCMRDYDSLYDNNIGHKEPESRKNSTNSDDDYNDWQIEAAAAGKNSNSLKEHLQLQILGLGLSDEEYLLCTYLINLVDENGFLQDTADSISELGADYNLAQKCLNILRELEPSGVCAYDVQECLLKQLGGSENDKIAAVIIKEHLDDLAKGHYSRISKAAGESLENVKLAAKRIRRLSPNPAAGFDGADEIQYIKPDVVVKIVDGKPVCELPFSYVSALRVYPHYDDLLRSTDDESLREYLSKKQYEAGQLIRNIQQREASVMKCAGCIAEIQNDFFVKKDELVPLTEDALANMLEVNKSTVSRMIRGKYIQCCRGVIPMSGLLSKKVSRNEGESSSIDRAKAMMSRLYSEEDKNNPLSDEEVSKYLSENSVYVSRRCVAKYREQLGIPNAYIRAQK